ncbi:MAG: hypothetical protein AABX72_01085 [Nanoarchaeota archaeon]
MKQTKQFEHVWILIGIVVVAVALSNINTEKTTGQIIQSSGCPPDKTIELTAIDTSTSGNWQDFDYKSTPEDAAEACQNHGSSLGASECTTYCGDQCTGTFQEDPNSGEISGWVTGNNGNYYGLPNSGWPGSGPLSPEDWKEITSSGAMAAECKIKGKCHCSPKEKDEKQYIEGEPVENNQQLQGSSSGNQRLPRQQSEATQQRTMPSQPAQAPQSTEGFFSRLWKALFGIFGIITLKKRE